MMRMINAFTGTEMWVADDRIEEYKAAGHFLPSVSEEPIVQEEAKVEAEVKEPKKATKTKTTTKKK